MRSPVLLRKTCWLNGWPQERIKKYEKVNVSCPDYVAENAALGKVGRLCDSAGDCLVVYLTEQ